MHFYQIQKSVYVYPFECTEEIQFLSEQLGISRFVIIVVSEIIQGENKIIMDFFDHHVLTRNDLKRT